MPQLTRRSILLKSRLGWFTDALLDIEQADVGAVHRARVASRRLRELLPVLELRAVMAGKVARRLRRVTRRLGRLRELDVLATAIAELVGARAHEQEAIAMLQADVDRSREIARRELVSKDVASQARKVAGKLAGVLKDLEERELGRGRDRAWRWALDARVARRAAALAEAIEAASSVYLAERLHAVRIALKKLRYAVELASEASARPDSQALGVLKRAQMRLGRMHDLQVLIDHVRNVQATMTPPNLNRWRDLDTLVRWLERRCRSLHAEYFTDQRRLVDLCARLTARRGDQGSRKAG